MRLSAPTSNMSSCLHQKKEISVSHLKKKRVGTWCTGRTITPSSLSHFPLLRCTNTIHDSLHRTFPNFSFKLSPQFFVISDSMNRRTHDLWPAGKRARGCSTMAPFHCWLILVNVGTHDNSRPGLANDFNVWLSVFQGLREQVGGCTFLLDLPFPVSPGVNCPSPIVLC